MSRRVAVIGGGASGMMAAITAAGEGADVTLYERNDRLGKKILATGNGKCNLSNEEMSGEKYHSGDNVRVQQWLEIFGVAETVAFFNRLGLMIRDRNGYLYPASEQASSVLDVLRIALVQAGVQVVTEIKINRIISRKGKVEIGWDNQSCTYDSAVIACGSKAAPKTGSDGSGYKLARQLGIAQTPVVPALVQLICREEYCKAIAGVRTDAQICVFSGKERTACERGELQLTEYGISGIPVFQLSGAVNYQLRVEKELRAEIDFFPGMSDAQYEEFAEERIKNGRNRTVEEFFTGMLHKKLMTLFIKLAGLKTNTYVEQADRERLREVFRMCRCFPLHITGSNSYDNAQICAGGVRLEEVTSQLEAVRAPGVFFAGEVLDVDGRCGGYNLQWAWTSGYIAGRAAGRRNPGA